MRRFPDVYLPGLREKLDAIRANDLNELQRQAMLNWMARRSSRELIVYDHFTGDSLDRGIWANNVDVPAAPADDSANGAFGAIRFNSVAPNAKLLWTNCGIPAGALNFSLAIRLRVASLGATYRFRFGLVDDVTLSDPAAFVGFQQDANAGNWLISVSDAGGTTPVGGPGWSSVAPSATYQLVELHKRDRTLSWAIDGVDMGSSDLYYGTGAQDRIFLRNDLPFYIYSANTADIWVDFASMWSGETIADGVNYRSAQDWRSTGEQPINMPAHHESKYATLAAVTSKSFTWDRAFDRDYRIYPSVQAAAPVSWLITAKSASGCTVTFSAAVTGAISVDAREVL